MNKLLVSLVALMFGAGAFAADCPHKNGNCKPKKQRIIYITAAEPEMYGEPVFEDVVLPEQPEVAECAEQTSELGRSIVSGDKAYIGARVGVHMPSWRNKYSATPTSAIVDADSDHDDYIFEPVFGGGIFAGRHFGPAWRGDIEFGYMTQFSDSDNGFAFKLSAPYLTANAYYDFLDGFYLGAGVGFAFPKATLDWEWFVANSATETRLSFIGGLSAGFARPLSENMILDIRYRIAGFYGPTWTRGVLQPEYGTATGSDLESLKTRVGFVLDNSISIGVRYEF